MEGMSDSSYIYHRYDHLKPDLELDDAVAYLLQFDPKYNCPRYRNTTISAISPFAEVEGRCGGGNRKEYSREIGEMCQQRGFVQEDDWADDDTYAIFRYQLDRTRWLAFLNRYQTRIQIEKEQTDPIWCSAEALAARTICERIAKEQESSAEERSTFRADCDTGATIKRLRGHVVSRQYQGWKLTMDLGLEGGFNMRNAGLGIWVLDMGDKVELELVYSSTRINKARILSSQFNYILATLEAWMCSEIVLPAVLK
jgi:hypothetical protein